MTSHPADSFMSIFGFKRIATLKGNVITPAAFEREDEQYAICGDHHPDSVPWGCMTGDGV